MDFVRNATLANDGYSTHCGRFSWNASGHRSDRGLSRLEANLRVLTVTERLGDGSATATEKDTFLASQIVKVSIPIPKVQLTQVTCDKIGSVLGCNDFDAHNTLLSITGAGSAHVRVTTIAQ
jgi:hypothetical protein